MLRKGRTAMSELDKIRENINSIDEQMAQLFEKRMEMSEQVAAFKKARGLSIRDAERERELIDPNRRHITDPAVASYYVQFLRGVLDLSCAYQSRLLSGMKVAYSGVEGAYGYLAARRMFPEARLVAYPDFAAAHRAVEVGEADSVVLPLENSYAGEVGAVMDLLFSGELYINQVLERGINTAKTNTTRFAALSRTRNQPETTKKREDENFVLVFTVQNDAGSLAQTLNIIGAHGYNMRTLRSRPMKGLSWKYFFYVEAEGCINNTNGREMLQELSATCAKLRLVGSYYANSI